ncbi:MAG: hypothetical protein Q9217_003123 [Psora testacea]
MESLNETTWDVILSGTGLSQSLLALALSRSGKKVLHLDKNNYYGGAEAALTLDEAETWAGTVKDSDPNASAFRQATIHQYQQNDPIQSKLGFSRAYSLSLSPQLIYTRSNLLPALVSSKVYRQLEFLAVGNWWIYNVADSDHEKEVFKADITVSSGHLRKIPGCREDVFADKTIDLRSSRSLMKFLKLAADAEAHAAVLEEWASRPFSEYLSTQYNIPEKLQAPLFALTTSPDPPSKTTTAYALPRIHRHLTSIGMFGPGFGAVVPKWGGLAEIAQVACRAGAVGGGVYVLGKGIKDMDKPRSQLHNAQTSDTRATIALQLDDGETVEAPQVVCSPHDLASDNEQQACSTEVTYRSISIISSPLSQLFSVPVEGAPPPAGSVVVFPSSTLTMERERTPANHSPVYLMVHSSDTGECPAGQCVIYAQTTPSSSMRVDSSSLLKIAVTEFLNSVHEDPRPQVLWCMHYTQDMLQSPVTPTNSKPEILKISEVTSSFVLEDDLLRNVRTAWECVVGEEKGDGFMTFADREDVGQGEEDEGIHGAL